jgi:hypothetical protein
LYVDGIDIKEIDVKVVKQNQETGKRSKIKVTFSTWDFAGKGCSKVAHWC